MITKDMKMRVVSNEKITADIYRIVAEIENMSDWSFVPGQFVMVKRNINGQMVRRAYSISSVPQILPLVELTVRRYPNGMMSEALTALEKGEEIVFDGAMGNFNIMKLQQKNACLMAIGCGVAPLKSMIESWCQLDENDVRVDLFLGVRHVEDVAYHNFWIELEKKYPGFNYYLCISQPGDVGYKYSGRVGEVMKKIKYNFTDKEYFISGTSEMVTDMKKLIVNQGGDLKKIYFENIFPIIKK